MNAIVSTVVPRPAFGKKKKKMSDRKIGRMTPTEVRKMTRSVQGNMMFLWGAGERKESLMEV